MMKWQKIDKKSLPHLEKHYLGFEPYCHLNVVDIWGWRVNKNHWFEVGDTIVYRLNDYNDDSSYITLLGNRSVKQAVWEICQKFPGRKTLHLGCVPQEALAAIKNWQAVRGYTEDLDSHDYIFDLEPFLKFQGISGKQKDYQKFIKRYSKIKVKPLNHNRPYDRRLIYKIFKKWAAQTGNSAWHKEFLALKRMLNLRNRRFVCLGFYDSKKFIGYTLNEPEPNGYYQAFSGKGDRQYSNLGFYMEYETAKYIHKHFGSRFMNLQPDQGLPGLREYKTALGPQRHLKKYEVAIDVGKVLAKRS